MDLTKEKWLPVIFSNGDKKKISLRDLLDNRIQDLAYPRCIMPRTPYGAAIQH
ncbi:type I-E CRISPR-associated protein Cse1/CasA [Salmonella enterica subsp. enterica serovar Kentucky]|nr:type I-E CRISPR-associated protein Cse1/CasA [Salmonella enterica subsp. enterica serovar Kentucky]